MIAFVLALALLGTVPETSVVYDDVPGEVQRVEIYEWQGSRAGLVSARARGTGAVRLRGTTGGLYVVMFARGDGAYLLDGPFAWPAADAARSVAPRWHRTWRGVVPADVESATPVEWIRADALPGPWPMCLRENPRGWACWGVLPENRGVIVLRVGVAMLWALAAGPPGELRRAAWGRLLLIADGSGEGSTVRVTFGRPVAPPPGRLRGIRLETSPVAGARAARVAPAIVWVVGEDVPAHAWAEIASRSGGPVYLALREIADGPASIPVHVALRPRRVLAGRVAGAGGEPAPGALISAFRLIDPPPADGSRVLPRRVLAAELVADGEGRFELDALGEAEYEVVAWHAQLGRASVAVQSAGSELTIRLRASGVARGRVMAGGRPLAGVDVISVPDPAAFGAAADITDVKGGDARTGADGRFIVMVAASGGGELRIGGGAHAVRRIALPRPPVPVFDAGDVELGVPIEVTVLLDRDPGCGVRAAGPVGRTGLQVVLAARTGDGAFVLTVPERGLWELTLVCPGERRALTPGVVEIGPRQAGTELRFVVR